MLISPGSLRAPQGSLLVLRRRHRGEPYAVAAAASPEAAEVAGAGAWVPHESAILLVGSVLAGEPVRSSSGPRITQTHLESAAYRMLAYIMA